MLFCTETKSYALIRTFEINISNFQTKSSNLRDEQLKNAFGIVLRTLSTVKICFDHALDASVVTVFFLI